MKIFKQSFFIIIVSAFFFSCGFFNSEVEQEGEVFIVTKGMNTLKLALVNICFIPEDSLIKYIDKTTIDSARILIDKYLPKIKMYRKKIDSLETELKFCEYDWKRENIRWLNALYITAYSSLIDGLTSTINGNYFHDEIFKNYSDFIVTRTNSEGKFIVKLNKKVTYAVVAKADRQIGEEKEQYFWLFWYSYNDLKGKALSLNNDNLFINNPKENIVDMSELCKNIDIDEYINKRRR